MTKNDLSTLLASKVIMLDGATGTELIKRGMPHGVCPEEWIAQHPQAIADVQRLYEQAGSDIIYTPTFGGNRYKLKNFGLENRVVELNSELAALSKNTLKHAKVFGDLAPTGQFVEPFGDSPIPFEDAVNAYKEQVKGLLEGGVDGFAIETMIDLQETRAALLAVKESTDLPVFTTLTFDESGRTLTGNTPEAAVITLQALGADAIGCNCSTGPAQMAQTIQAMAAVAKVPIIAKPNAGMPRLDNGKTVFDLQPEEFAQQLLTLIDAGAAIVGGCCGTTPDHIAAATRLLRGKKPTPPPEKHTSCVCFARGYREMSPAQPFAIIGERINPTGKKALQAELKASSLDLVRKFAQEQTAAGADLLDVNMGMPNIDEQAMMRRAIAMLGNEAERPLCIDTTKPDVAEAALRLYPGRALFNSISAEKERLEKVLPIAAKYGAMLVILPLDDNGIPETPDQRIAIAQRIMAEAANYGYKPEDFILDGLVMTVSSNQSAAKSTLELIRWASEHALNTVCGLSNVSFGLPRRDLINRAFLAMAIANGLNHAIANPMLADILETARACDVLTERDDQSRAFIQAYANTTPQTPAAVIPAAGASATPADGALPPPEALKHAVITADEKCASAMLQKCLADGIPPKTIVDDILIPAITAVGEKFEKKEYFLPQLLGAAKAMRLMMATLEPMLQTQDNSTEKKTPFILATVKGDIHDIGKNIVALMLKNYHFDVIDLGRDVPADVILDAAIQHNATLIGLSALMTTTMTEMKTVIDTAKARGLHQLKFIIGGAVVTEDYANTIGAFYSKDAMDTVRIAERLK